VLDDCSQDKTTEIAKEYTDKVFQKEMSNEGAHRNYAYSLASNEWVLSLDADERITPELQKEITSILDNGTDCNGFSIPRKNFLGDYWIRHGGWYPSAQLKLFKRDEFKYEEVDVHPRAFMEDPRGNIESPLLHYSYRDIEDFVAKQNNQTSRESEKWFDSEKGMPFSRAFRRTIDRFFRAYSKKKGKKDGILGYILAVMGGFYQLLSYAKYWGRSLKISDPYTGTEKDENIKKDIVSSSVDNQDRRKLSVVILTKNAEKKVRKCLESVTWANEIVIVDGFSSDNTVEICKEYGAKIVQHKFEGDFGEERNIGIDNSSGDWVLQLDSDEIVTEGFKNKMIEILERKEDEFVSYRFLRKNYFMGHFMKYGGWYHYSHHLLKKGFARYKGNIHEKLLVDGKTGKLDADIEHYPFHTFSELIDRQNRYTTLQAKEIFSNKEFKDEKDIIYNIKVKPYKLFWKFYVKKKGFREGMYGFIFSGIFAWIHLLKWSKCWELYQASKSE